MPELGVSEEGVAVRSSSCEVYDPKFKFEIL